MKRSIEISFQTPLLGQWIIAPRPFDHWGQRFEGFQAEGVSDIREARAENSECRSYMMRADAETVRLQYDFELSDPLDPECCAPDWVWRIERSRFTEATAELAEQAQAAANGAASERAALRRLIDVAAEIFDYDHPDTPFNAGAEDVPLLCGTTKGNCVDINTYILASSLAIGLRGQYIAGYWFHPEKTETQDMHCWLAFEPAGELVFWDLAHALKWRATLGAEIQEGLNPAGGRRVAMSCGRGLAFQTPLGRAVISHFSEPILLAPDASRSPQQIRPDLTIFVREPEGCRTQTLAGDAPALSKAS